MQKYLILLAAGFLLAACQSPSTKVVPSEPPDGAPDTVPDFLGTLPDPVVVEEPRSARGNPESYRVNGRTYRVMDSAAGYYATGRASWYGRKFHGRLTSSGEPFDMFKLTAAHRSLPIPAFVRVTNLENGRSTVVRINDRGPFHDDRIIDLSFAAAVKLDFADSGTASVRVEVLVPDKDFTLQAGAFRDLMGADRLKVQLQAMTGEPIHVVKIPDDGLYRVQIGPLKGRSAAEQLQARIVAARIAEPLILPH